MKNKFRLLSVFWMLSFLFSVIPVYGKELVINENIIVDSNSSVNHAYGLDLEGNSVSINDEDVFVSVVYDGTWDGMRAANVPRVINVKVVCSGTGILSNPMYNCTLSVALELRYNSDTMIITSVGTPDVYYYSAPGAVQNAKNPRATVAITNGGRSVTIYGYIDYTASIYSQTFTGATTYYL